MAGSRASPSMSGSSVVPGLPNMTLTPSSFRISRKACLPETNGMKFLLGRGRRATMINPRHP